ncbi:MAG: helix-turn-helix transcriptional regulator [Bacteroidetes bacterium]|nr:helix-turn-helix transcriptional regulator [Bacteroidota bacterium]
MTIQNIYQYIDHKGITVTEFSKATGVSNGYFAKQRSANGAVSSHIIEKIVSIYGDINAEWLITGKGEMLKRNKDQKVATISQESASELSLQAREKLIPYYDVDFAAGAVEMYNDPSQVSYYLDVPEFTVA